MLIDCWFYVLLLLFKGGVKIRGFFKITIWCKLCNKKSGQKAGCRHWVPFREGKEKTPARNQAHSAGEMYGPTSEETQYTHLYDK